MYHCYVLWKGNTHLEIKVRHSHWMFELTFKKNHFGKKPELR